MKRTDPHRDTVAPAGLSAALAALLAVAAIGPAHGGTASDWSAAGGTAVRLLAGGAEAGALAGGVEIRLAPGWKTYWRYPGDSGVPPHFDWSGSENLAAAEIRWPAPMRFDDGAGSFSIGYKHDVVLPFRLRPQDASRPVRLKLDLDFAVCAKICQPAHASLALELPAGGVGGAPAALAAAEQMVPRPAPLGTAGNFGIERVALDRSGSVPVLRVEARVRDAADTDLFAEGPNDDWALPLPARELQADGRAVFVLPLEGVPKDADLASSELRLTLVDQAGAVEVAAPLFGR